MRTTISLKKNFIYNFSLNIINILFPLITAPYISRVLGADNLGKYNFSLSFSSWFLIFATFGTSTYGVREIAKVRDNKEQLDKTFSEIFLINFIATFCTLIVYIIIILSTPKTNAEIVLFLISGISIFMNLFCIDWLFMGLEDFRMITFRSLLIKLICLVCIFTFVRLRNDYTIYALISVFAFGFANLINFVYSRKFVMISFKNINLKKHIGKLKIFFFSAIVVSMYTIFDQVFLGFFSTNKDVAFYSRAKQIYYIAITVTLSISTVLLPKLTYLYKNDLAKYKSLLKKSINYIYIFSVPSVFGLMVLSKDIMWMFGGKEFADASISLIILSVLVFTVSLGTWQYDQLFLPLGIEKIGLKAQAFMAISSMIGNVLLIPKFGFIGASISLVIAEICGTIYGVWYIKNKTHEFKIKYFTQSLAKYVFASLVMTLVIILFKLFKYGYIPNIIFGIFVGVFIYFAMLCLLNDDVSKEFLDYLRNKIKKTT
ncbi:MAG: flippase [Eubacteriales bacterium]